MTSTIQEKDVVEDELSMRIRVGKRVRNHKRGKSFRMKVEDLRVQKQTASVFELNRRLQILL